MRAGIHAAVLAGERLSQTLSAALEALHHPDIGLGDLLTGDVPPLHPPVAAGTGAARPVAADVDVGQASDVTSSAVMERGEQLLKPVYATCAKKEQPILKRLFL